MAPGTRDALLDVAVCLLDDGGVEAVTLREVGHRSGVSHNAPYKHFTSKQALLAAIAARELRRRATLLALATKRMHSPQAVLRATLHGYVAWALEYPARFKLVFGRWSIESEELRLAAEAAQAMLVEVIVACLDAGDLPPGDPVRLASLVRAVAHGAADLASVGHLASEGKGHASPQDLVDDLLAYLRIAANAVR